MKPLEITQALGLLEEKKQQIDRVYEEERKKITIQCEHEWTYHSDPSGNNDSGYSCSGCGAWLKKRP